MVRGILGNQIDCFFGYKGSFAAVFSGILIILRMMTRDSGNGNDDDSDNDNDDDSDNDKDNPLFSFQETGLICHLLSLLANLADCNGGGFFPLPEVGVFFPY